MSETVVRPPHIAPDAPSPQMALERIQGASLIGWALDPAEPGTEHIGLRCGSTRIDATVHRVAREDVRRSFQVEALALGFEIELPLSIWQTLASTTEPLQVLVNGQVLPHTALRPTEADLNYRLQQLALAAPSAQRDRQTELLQAHLAQARQRQAPPVLGRAAAGPSGLVSANVERWRGLVLCGWAADTPAQRAPVLLRCGSQTLTAALRRVSRHDVAQALLLEDEMIGFELEVPGSIWQEAGNADRVSLQVLVGGVACGEAQTLLRSDLAQRLDDALGLPDAAEREYQALLAMEHLVHAQALDGLDDGLMTALRSLASGAGVLPFLSRPPSAVAPLATGSRQPVKLRPRGRLGRWLEDPDHAARALRWLLALRARPALAGAAERLEVALTLAQGWFDKALYDDQVPAAARGGLSALRHYVRHGDAQSLVPMALFDPRHYTGQLAGRRHPGINRLLHHGLWGRFQGLSVSDWFDSRHYLQNNADVAESGQDPLLHFLNFGWKEQRRPHPDFQPRQSGGGHLMQRLGQGTQKRHPDPRVNFLLDGLPAAVERPADGRLPWMPPTHLDDRDHLVLAPWRGLPRRDPSQARVNVIVPVYAGVQETLRCLWSVLDAEVSLPFELVVIDDCSPDPALSAFLRELAGLGLLRLLVNAQNQGFVATVNLGLSLNWDRDVVILNADTRVHDGWLDRLAAHAVAEPRAASITPLSNHATICSYPHMPAGNPPPTDPDDAELDRLAARANRQRHVEAPTGVGFCMWMRRSCLDAIGLLDTQRFGRGYGEENDWCLRARAAGWVNLIAADVFVLHQGSVSFSGETSPRIRAALATLAERYPDYGREVDDWIRADPLRAARARLDAARLREHSGPRVVLMISHARGGGTARLEREQAARLKAEQGLGTLLLRPSRRPGGLTLCAVDGSSLPNLDGLPAEADGLLVELLGLFEVAEVQLHHLADQPPALRQQLPAICRALGAPLTVTVHDYHLICPRINLVDDSGRYCGEPDAAGCRRCLKSDGLHQRSGDIASWRAAHGQLLAAASHVVVPDEDVARRLRRYYPALKPDVRPHEPPPAAPAQTGPRSTPPQRVLVIGALSRIKGFEVLLGLARSQTARQAEVQFTLLGHAADDAALREAGVTVLGRYDDATLDARVAELRPDLILLPSVWPETYCYVLTAAMAAGCPVAVFDLGAQARRLREWDPSGQQVRLLPLAEAAQPELLALRLLALG